jgi:hypothetical protein
MNQYDVIIKKLTDQISEISRESAIYYSLYVKEKQENETLQKEISELKSKDE